MAMNKLRRFVRRIQRFFRRLRSEARMFGRSVLEVIDNLIQRVIQHIQLRYNCLQVRERMCKVRSNAEWESYATLLDHLERTVDWKYVQHSNSYDYVRLEQRRQMMKQLRNNGNVKTLSYCIRADLAKNICNVSDRKLYNQCHLGTKRSIEKYIDEVIKCIQFIYAADPSYMSIDTKLEFFRETRHAYGRTALLLSGGATFGKFHWGLIKALYEQDLFPRIICGSSVGSLICAGLACAPYKDIPKYFDPEYTFAKPILGRFTNSKLQFFTDMLRGKVVLDTKVLKDYVYEKTGDKTFREVYQNFGWNLNITVTDQSLDQAPRLLNYLTAPNVLIWSAVVASCAIPGMFAPVELMQKLDNGEIIQYDPCTNRMQFQDGSVGSDLPMQRLTELFNVNTFIVSQVNPHVCPFVSVDSGQVLDTKIQKRFLRVCKEVTGNSLVFALRQSEALGILPTYIKGIANMVVQSYKGHVTVVPSPSLKDYYNLLQNVTPESFQDCFQAMYVQSLRKMSRIKSYYLIEREFDRYYDLLKSQLRDGSDFPDLHDDEELKIKTARTLDQSKAWDNPNWSIPIEKAHLNMTDDDDPQIYEKLSVFHDTILPCSEVDQKKVKKLDPSMLEFLFETPTDQWDVMSLQQTRESLSNPETRNNFRKYLQSKPHKKEVRLIKELMLDQLKQQSLPELNPLHDQGKLKHNVSLVSLLTDNSAAHDVQLAYYANMMDQKSPLKLEKISGSDSNLSHNNHIVEGDDEAKLESAPSYPFFE